MRLDKDDPRLMDYVLGELEDGEALDVAAALADDENQEARAIVDELRGVADTTRRILQEDSEEAGLTDAQREEIVGQADDLPENVVPGPSRWFLRGVAAKSLGAVAALGVIVAGFFVYTGMERAQMRMAAQLVEDQKLVDEYNRLEQDIRAYYSINNANATPREPELKQLSEPLSEEERDQIRVEMTRHHWELENYISIDASDALDVSPEELGRLRDEIQEAKTELRDLKTYGEGNQSNPSSDIDSGPETVEELERLRSEIQTATSELASKPSAKNEPEPSFEVYDSEMTPETIAALPPEQQKEVRIREHIKYADLYREQGHEAQAIEIYDYVLQVDPDNEEAKDGRREAEAAYSPEEREQDRLQAAQDSDKIRRYIEESKQLPEGAETKGIKNYVFRVPEEEDINVTAENSDGSRLLGNSLRDWAMEPKPEPKPEPRPEPNREEWAEYNVGNLTGQTELPGPVASNDELESRDRVMPYSENWQWNTPNDKPTEIVGGPGTETYVKVAGVKPFLAVREEPLSTFSIDVDTAAYSNVRRFLSQGQLPPPDAVRIEEMINYFDYAYPQPVDGRPFAVNVMGAPAPWDPRHRLVRIGVKGKEVPQSERPPANLVFLLDVSGSMGDANKLPLVKESMKTLLGQLRPNDRVAIVTYAGSARKVLDPTPCSERGAITAAIDSLTSGGSTNGGGGIQLAYDLAGASFVQEGINRVIIATDGDFNVGTTAHGDLMSMIEARAKSGVFLTALGFGMGNLKDSTLEQLANRGNGNYAYIDNHAEARRALVDQLAGTLQTIAKDVKIQVEFNPALVSHYRLLGYENRALANRDFNDDTKDAGEIGAGHTVTALYEIIPVGGSPAPGVDPLRYESSTPGVDPLRYGNEGAPAEEDSIAPGPEPAPRPAPPAFQEWLTVKMRYKEPQGNESTKLEVPLTAMNGDLRETDADFRFASAVAAFGQVLRHSGYRHASNFDRIIEMARASANGNPDREAFVDMVITAKTLSGPR